MNLFFSEGGPADPKIVAICEACPVNVECQQLALDFGRMNYGIWGGTTLEDRRRMLKRRRAA